MNNETPRETIAKAMHQAVTDEAAARGVHGLAAWDTLTNSSPYATTKRKEADAVIKYLWKKASDPEIVEAIAKFGVEDWDGYVPDGPLQDGLRQRAKGEIAELLTLLIGLPLSK